MSDAEKKASITPRQPTTLSSKVPITPRTSDAVASGGSVKVSTVASASSSKSSSTVTALMENKMSKMKEHLMKQKAKQDEQREKQFSDAMQQSEKLVSELSQQVAKLTTKCLDADAQLKAVQERYEMQLEELQLQLESANLDKELAEQELEDLKLSIFEQQESLIHQSHSDSNVNMNDILVENSKMKQIVLALRDMQQTDKKELQGKIEILSATEQIVLELESRIIQYTDKIAKLEETISELHEQISVAQSSEEMIEALTEKNLVLGEKVAKLEKQLVEYDEEKAIHSEVDRYNEELIKGLREDLFKKEEEFVIWERDLIAIKNTLNEKDSILARFRSKIIELSRELSTVKTSRESEESQLIEYKNRSNNLLVTYHNLQEQLKKLMASSIDQDIQTAVIKYNDEFSDAIKLFIPEDAPRKDVESGNNLQIVDILNSILEVKNENEMLSKKAEEAKQQLSSFEELSNKLVESSSEIERLTNQKNILESKLESTLNQKEEIEGLIRNLQSKDRYYNQIEERLKSMEDIRKDLDETKQKEVQYQNEVNELKFQIETLEQQNHVLQQQLVGTQKIIHEEREAVDITSDSTTKSTDLSDRIELLSLRSAVRQMKSNRMKEVSQRNERNLRRILANKSNQEYTTVWDKRYQTLKNLSKLTKGLAKNLSCLPMVDLVDVQNKGSIENQCIRQQKQKCLISTQFQQFQEATSKIMSI